MDAPLCLLTVHAHPDDEASKGAGTVALYADQGVRTVLVCATGGEEGDILNPALDKAEIRNRLAEVRKSELDAAAKVIGYDVVHMLGYRDSGMADTEANSNPNSFAAAALDEAVGRLVALIREERPQVIITYSDNQQGYDHPDHIRVHDISVLAFDRAGDPNQYPELGKPWTPSKLYYTVWSRDRIVLRHDAFVHAGLESPYDERWFDRPSQDERITTKISLGKFTGIKSDALLAHATQVDPESTFWFGLPEDVEHSLYPYDDYILAQSRVATARPESDLFAGLRNPDGA